MEIRLRPLMTALIAVVMICGLGYLVCPRFCPRLAPAVASLWPWPDATAASTPTPAAVPTGGPEITYLDESLGWDWEAACAPQFRQFLAEKLPGRQISAVKIVLVDYTPDSRLPFGVRYPDEAGVQANANCYDMGGSSYTCPIGVERGEPGADLDVATTLAVPYTLLDMSLARGPNPDAVRRTWRWSTFQPLIIPIEEAENRWQSSCLRVSRAR